MKVYEIYLIHETNANIKFVFQACSFEQACIIATSYNKYGYAVTKLEELIIN